MRFPGFSKFAFSCVNLCRYDKMVARAMTRKGNALVKKGELQLAIDQYQKSLMEHRSADTLTRLNTTEKTLKVGGRSISLDFKHFKSRVFHAVLTLFHTLSIPRKLNSTDPQRLKAPGFNR
jgi:hypothetical protein